MAYINLKEAHAHLRDSVLDGLKRQFPIEGRLQSLHLEKVETSDALNPEDIRAQYTAKMNGDTWANPVHATLVLKNNATGAVVDQRRMKVAEIPQITPRYSYIVKGQEYQVDNQWQLKPGIYTQRRQTGELETRFNTVGKSAFDIVFHPDTKQFVMDYNSSKIPIYPIMKTMGVSDEAMEKSWGKEVFEANKNAKRTTGALVQFAKTSKKFGEPVKDFEQHLIQTMHESKLDPDATELTLGRRFDRVTGDALHLATKKLLRVQAGHPEDDRDSLAFKTLRSIGDYAKDSMLKSAKDIRAKVDRKINHATDIRDVVKSDMFNRPVRAAFVENTAVNSASQINPAEMLSASLGTTILGNFGGIQSEQRVSDAAKLINTSHFGFIDPINTPEGPKVGISLRLASGVKKIGNVPYIRLYSTKTGKTEDVDPVTALKSHVVMADQVTWDGGKPKALYPVVKMLGPGNEPTSGKMGAADYVMRRPNHFLNISSNLIPFIQNTNGARAMYATKHLEQAISLVNREIPLVQASTGPDMPEEAGTYAKFIGGIAASHRAPISGEVVQVKKDEIIIKSGKGENHSVQIYHNFPLNDPKSVLHSTPLVKVGDKVKSGQTIADTNFSRNGVLALGANLRVGYIPMKSYNYEDGIVASETAAQKLASEHMYKNSLVMREGTVLDTRRFAVQHPTTFTREQLGSVGTDGIIAVGSRVKPGDPLIVAMHPYLIKDRTGVGAIRKSLMAEHTDASLKWEAEHEGKVVSVHKGPDKITVHVRTVEPLQVGDKVSHAHAGKGIVTQILPDKEMPYTKDGRPIEIGFNPCGIPGRMNVGQILEACAGKIAQKTGKTYIVENFAPGNADTVTAMKAELKKHGLTDKEEFFDPASGKSMGRALVGPIHMLKLVHQIDKKLSVRSGMTLPGVTSESEYSSSTLQPRGGGHEGGQAIGALGVYALLAHGARCFTGATEIRVKGGKKRNQISDIVRNRKAVLVESYNSDTCVFEYKPVVAWQVRVADPTELVVVEYTAGAVSGRKLHYKTKCTAGHEFYTPTGKVEAGDLTAGDVLLMPGKRLHPIQRQLVLGSTLGDAYLTGKAHHGSGVSACHGADQRQYLLFKRRILAGLGEMKVRKGLPKNTYAKKPKYAFNTQTNGEITEIRRKFYMGKKGVPADLLQEMTEVALAFWFMDDGDTCLQKAHGYNYRTVRLATCAFSAADVESLVAWLRTRWGLSAKVYYRQRKYPYVTLFNKEADKFLNLVAPYIPRSMVYKLQLNAPKNNVDVAKVGSGLSCFSGIRALPGAEPVVVKSVKPWTPRYYEDYLVYNIEVEDNHNYIANGVLVGNSNLREMQSYKAEGQDTKGNPAKSWPSQHHQIWAAIQSGTPLPTPRPTYAFHKFTNMLKGAGINIEKKGHEFILGPLTDAHILELSNGEIKDPTRTVHAKFTKGDEPKPMSGGIFDERVTGGLGGQKWSHVSLAEPLPNPVFEAPIKHLAGLTGTEYEAIVYGKKAVAPNGKIVAVGMGAAGGAGIKILLDKINVDSALKSNEAALKTAPASKIDSTLKRVKYLRALQELGMKTPSEAYMLHNLPILPPANRPLAIFASGDIKYDDINGLYKTFGQLNSALKDPTLRAALTDKRRENLRKDYYDGIRAIMGVHIPYANAPQKGLLHLISGKSPKTGIFQDILISRRQDLAMRSTIIPEPSLGLDEVGLPKHAALKLFAPFLVKKIVELGGAPHALAAQKVLAASIGGAKNSIVDTALAKVTEERPVLLKRDPVLHKYGIQAFHAKPMSGSAIRIHPMLCASTGGDFDGDTMSAYVPITAEAVAEAHKMMPSNNLFSEATGKLMYKPEKEMIPGLYRLSDVGKRTAHKFSSIKEAIAAAGAGKAHVTDQVLINGKPSTPGRAILAEALPEPMQHDMLHNLDLRLNSKAVGKLLTDVGKKHKADFGVVANRMMILGGQSAYGIVTTPGGGAIQTGVYSFGLDDMTSDKESRKRALDKAAVRIRTIASNAGMSRAEKEKKSVDAWEDADADMRKMHFDKNLRPGAKPTELFMAHAAGVKPDWEQYKQLALAPMLMQDSLGRVIPNPITHSYGEGLDMAEYWTHLHGTRRGVVRKTQEVREPGYMTKQLQQTAVHLNIDSTDCGTTRGIALAVADDEVHDRYLQQDFKSGSLHVPAGTMLSPDVVGKMRAIDKNAQIVVRSPLRCESDKGICAHCAGLSSSGNLHPIGTAIGVQAVHPLGERAVQLMMKSFHTAGTISVGGVDNQMDRLWQLTDLPKVIPNSSVLASSGGKIEKIEKDVTGHKIWVNDEMYHVGKDKFGHSLAGHAPGLTATVHDNQHWTPPHVGQKIETGQTLSDPTRTIVNPHDLYAATGNIEKVQNYLTKEIFKLYKDSGVKRRHVETVVRAMTGLTQVKDPGGSELLRGEIYPVAKISKLNQELKDKIIHVPVVQGISVLPYDLHEDWMAKLQHERLTHTITEAAATLGRSNIHSPHPIPALAYGAEFGLTDEDSKKPGLAHLRGVPKHHY